jgi:MFS family permease
MTASEPGARGLGLWRNRNWRLYWTGQSISVAGDYVFDITVLLWVARIIAAHQPWAPAAASGVLIAAGLPALAVGPFAGVFVDRWNRKRTMLTADAARALLAAALVPLSFASVTRELPQAAQLAAVYVVVAAAACFSQFFGPSRFAMLGVIVPQADVPKASSLMMSASYTASIIAPPLAAPLLFAAGARWALIINAVSFLVSFATICLVRPGTPAPAGDAVPDGKGSYWREFAAGLRFFASTPVLVAVTAGITVTVLGAAAINTLNVFFLQANLHSNASLYGTIGMAEGIGGVLGTLACARVLPRIDSGKAFCAGLALAGLALILYSRASSLLPALAIIAVTGAMLAGVNVAVSPLVLKVTPQHMIGRVESVIGPIANLALIGSTALAGTLVSTLLRGFHQTVAGISFGPYDTIIGAGGLLFVVAGLLAWPTLRLPAEEAALAQAEG